VIIMMRKVHIVYVEDKDKNWYIEAIYANRNRAEQRRIELESELSPDVYYVGVLTECLIE